MEGIDYLHKNDICHRDIKPSNIMITEDKKIFIVDFNVSKQKEEGEDKFRIVTKAGTIAFSAPEIFLKDSYE